MKYALGLVMVLALLTSACSRTEPTTAVVVEKGGDYATLLDQVLEQRLEENRKERDKAIAALTDKGAVEARQKHIREEFTKLIGGLPEGRTPLNAKVTGVLDRESYTIEKVVYESMPGFKVTANLYIPKNGKGPFPAVLGTAGHSPVGKAADTYQSFWSTVASRGVVVLAFDPVGQGERLEYLDPTTGKPTIPSGTSQHSVPGMQMLLTGQNIARYFIWDGIRGVDYLLTRKEVDPKRIMTAGNSGGGTQSSYIGVAEPRLAGVLASCYPTNWRHLWGDPGPQDAEQVFAGWIVGGFDFSDFAIAAAPRKYLMSSAERDYFEIDGARQTYQESKKIFGVLGAEDAIQHITADEKHGWSKPLREQAYAWFAKAFNAPTVAGEEKDLKLEKPKVLEVTPTGQLLTSLGTRTVREMTRERAKSLAAKRQAAQKAAPLNADAIRKALQMRTVEGVPAAKSLSSKEIDGIKLESIELETEAGIRIPAVLYLPSTAAGKEAVVMASSAGKNSDVLELSALAFAKEGKVVLAVDPRAMGEAAHPERKGGYSALYQVSARGWLMNESLAGMQTNDILAAMRYMRSRPEASGAALQLVGSGTAGPLVLFAAAIDGNVQTVSTENAIRSYEDLINADLHKGMENLIVPGLLAVLDLPEVVAVIGQNKVTMNNPFDFATLLTAE